MISSPCLGLCRIDEQLGLCVGCARTGAEIAVWREAPAGFRQKVWAELPARRACLGSNLYRLDWAAKDLRYFILDTLRPAGGAWTSGGHGANVEFHLDEHEICRVQIGQDSVCAVSPRGAISFRLGDHIRALSFSAAAGQEIIVLAVPRGKAQPFLGDGLVRVGPDQEAVREEDRHEILYDLGVDRSAAGFGFRTGNPKLMAKLDAAVGSDWRQVLRLIHDGVQRASPTFVARNSIGRIEVFAALSAARPPYFPFDRPSEKRDANAGIDVPEAYVAAALHSRRAPAGIDRVPETQPTCP